MKDISVYDSEYDMIIDICKSYNVYEWEVIETFFDIIREEGIDISEWL